MHAWNWSAWPPCLNIQNGLARDLSIDPAAANMHGGPMRGNLVTSVSRSTLLVGAVACGADPAASPAIVSGPGIAELYAASHSGLRASQRTVISDDTEWSSTWDAINADVNPAPPRPAVDLTKQAVIVVALGERHTGGFAIRVDSVRPVEGGRQVFVTTIKPGASCMTTQAMTQPVHVVTVPATAGSIRFADAETTNDCAS